MDLERLKHLRDTLRDAGGLYLHLRADYCREMAEVLDRLIEEWQDEFGPSSDIIFCHRALTEAISCTVASCWTSYEPECEPANFHEYMRRLWLSQDERSEFRKLDSDDFF